MTISRRNLLRTASAGAALTLIPSWMHAGIAGGGSPNADIQIGVIGCGKQANGLSRHLAILGGNKIVAACDVHANKLQHYVAQRREEYAGMENSTVPEITTYADYRELIDHPGLDAILLATPDHQHAPICIAALEKGLHVYCEKPLAHTIEEGRAMVEATEASGKVLQTGSMQRSMHTFGHAVELIRAGKIGEVSEAIVSIGPPPIPYTLNGEEVPSGLDWKAWIGPSVMRPYHPTLVPPVEMNSWGAWRDYAEFGGGMITDWGAHMFDIVQWAMDKDSTGPTQLFVPSGKPREGLTFFYEDGLKVTHRQFGRGNAVRFVGSEGTIDVSRGFLDSNVRGLISPVNRDNRAHGQANQIHFTEWLSAIRGEGEVSCPVETGHRTASICTLANIAYRLGRTLEWDPAAEQITNDSRANRLLGPEYRLSLA